MGRDVPNTQVHIALGRFMCGQHLVDVSVDCTMYLARDEPGTEVRGALDRLTCGRHLAALGVDCTGHLAGLSAEST